MQILSRKDALERFTKLDAYAAQCYQESKDQITQAILALHTIRSEGLYLQGGYNDWKSYLEDFQAQNGISRSITYDNLSVARIAGRAGLTYDEIEEYGIYPLKPFFEQGGPVIKYNRNTGEIVEIDENVMKELGDGDDLSLRYGAWVRDNIEAGDPPSVVRSNVKAKITGVKHQFLPLFVEGKWTRLQWSREQGDEYREGLIEFTKPVEIMPDDTKFEFFRLLKVPKDWYE